MWILKQRTTILLEYLFNKLYKFHKFDKWYFINDAKFFEKEVKAAC